MIILGIGGLLLVGILNLAYYEYRYTKPGKVQELSLIGWKL